MNQKNFFAFLLVIGIALSQPYDFIFVGLGSSSSITLSKLVKVHPTKSFLAIEMGGPTSASIGGKDYPSYFKNQPANNKATIMDVPGEYSNTPWNSQGEPYRISQIDWTWQGKGFGGNSQFNGMLYQEAPDDYLNSLPTGWKSSDLRPYFNEIRSKMTISITPSADKKTYLGGIHDALAAVFTTLGWTQQDTSNLGNLGKPGYYSRPYVASDGNGKRGSPVSAYLSSVVGANGLPSAANLQIIPFAQVQKILFAGGNAAEATGVIYTKDGSNTQLTATLKTGGRIVCGAGALLTPRLLYLSGVGPSGKESQVMDNPNVPFVRNNVKVGAALYDHVGTQLAFVSLHSISLIELLIDNLFRLTREQRQWKPSNMEIITQIKRTSTSTFLPSLDPTLNSAQSLSLTQPLMLESHIPITNSSPIPEDQEELRSSMAQRAFRSFLCSSDPKVTHLSDWTLLEISDSPTFTSPTTKMQMTKPMRSALHSTMF